MCTSDVNTQIKGNYLKKLLWFCENCSCNYSYTIWCIQFNPAITWECFTEQFTHKYWQQVKQQLTDTLENAVIDVFLISEVNFITSSIMMPVMKRNDKTTPSTGYRYTVNDGSVWKNEKHHPQLCIYLLLGLSIY